MNRKFGFKFISLIGLLLTSCSFNKIFGPSVESVTIIGKKDEIYIGDTFQVDAQVFPENAKNTNITWKSSNEEIASINDIGAISALKIGSTTIEAISKQNTKIKDSFELKVIDAVVTSIEIESLPTKIFYYETETFDPSGLSIKAHYSNATEKVIPYDGNESEFTFNLSLDKPLDVLDHTIWVRYKEKGDSFELNIQDVSRIEKSSLAFTYDDYCRKNFSQVDNCPLEGNPKLLIIPIWFKDSDQFIDESKKDGVRSDIEKAYIGSTSDTGWHSVKTYYETESFNAITLDATITDWYNVDSSYTSYGGKTAYTKTSSLVKKASDYYFNNSSDTRADYDSNNDGYLDGVMLIYAAPDYDTLGDDSLENLWAYCYWTGEMSSRSTPAANVFFWASYDFMYGSNAFEKTGSEYARGYTEHGVTIDTHCFIHEMGHVFGLEDYYDYSDYEYNPAGGFSMQDMNVGGHDPYSVMAYGWAKPYIPDKSMIISLGDFQSTHDIILLSNHEFSNSPFDEYLLLEYYTPNGLNERDSQYSYRDKYPQGSSEAGIRLWHVDARLFSGYPSPANLTTKPTDGNVHHAMSNSYAGNYASMMGSQYYNYNILQLIRNDINSTYTPKENFTSETLFKAGETFEISTYSLQFVKGSKMNDNNDLGWSFKVERLNKNNAIISLTKLQ